MESEEQRNNRLMKVIDLVTSDPYELMRFFTSEGKSANSSRDEYAYIAGYYLEEIYLDNIPKEHWDLADEVMELAKSSKDSDFISWAEYFVTEVKKLRRKSGI